MSSLGSEPLVAPADRATLDVLLAFDAAVDLRDLLAVCGPQAGPTIDELRERGFLVEAGTAVALTVEAAQRLRLDLPLPSPAGREVTRALAERLFLGGPDEQQTLPTAALALARAGFGGDALALVRRASSPLTIADRARLERLLRRIAAVDSAVASQALLLLARRQLTWGDIHSAGHSLELLAATTLSDDEDRLMFLLKLFVLARKALIGQAAVELERRRKLDRHPALELAAAAVASLRGEAAAAQALLREAATAGAETQLPGWSALTSAFIAIVEYRFEEGLREIERARQRFGLDAPPMIVVLEAIALAGADEVGRLGALARQLGAASLTPISAEMALTTAIARWRQGELVECIGLVDQFVAERELAGDRLIGVALSTIAAWAHLGMGNLLRADQLVRQCDGQLADSRVAGLRPVCGLLRMRLDAARGDWSAARQRIEEMAARWPSSPVLDVEAAWALEREPHPPTGNAMTALAALRSAERALHEQRWSDAESAAADAERWYRAIGCYHDRALALLQRGEALVQLDQIEKAEASLTACLAIAHERRYRIVIAAVALIRASIADRGGDIDGYVRELRCAVAVAAPDLWSVPLQAACARVRLTLEEQVPAEGQPLRDRVRRLGLTRPATRLCALGDRLFLLSDEDRLPECDLVLEAEQGKLSRAGREQAMTSQQLEMVALLAQRPLGTTAEELYTMLHPGAEYHPLRNRNGVHVALTRLRAALARVVGDEAMQKTADGRYRLAPTMRVAVLVPARIACSSDQPAIQRWRALVAPESSSNLR